MARLCTEYNSQIIKIENSIYNEYKSRSTQCMINYYRVKLITLTNNFLRNCKRKEFVAGVLYNNQYLLFVLYCIVFIICIISIYLFYLFIGILNN